MKLNKQNIYYLILYSFIAFLLTLFLLIYLDFDLYKLFNKSYLLDESIKVQNLIKENFTIFIISYFFLYIFYVSFVPITFPIIVITSIIFNPILGSIISTICITLGSAIFFIFFVKTNLVSLFNLDKIRNNKLSLKLKKNELLSIFLFRVTGGGGMPLIIQNLILFYSKVRFKNFIFGTLLGILPGNILISFLGIGIFNGLKLLLLS
jgi:uncharacterized membrane protein YdjX (TVP38/TMEM64 family)|tara:strand:- start:432 stop:1052 length:621 start_codon:yes stop_codon:yes gene_type:complete